MAPSAARSRFVLLALFGMLVFTFLLFGGHGSSADGLSSRSQAVLNNEGSSGVSSGAVLTGHAIAPKLGNATAK